MAVRNTTATAQADENATAQADENATAQADENATASALDTAPTTAPEDKLTNAKIDSEAKSMRAILDARPKRTVKIKAAEGAPPVGVGINGYTYRIPVNKHVEVPDVVADLLEKGDYI